MTDEQLRALVRDAVARHLSGPLSQPASDSPVGHPPHAAHAPRAPHPSHHRYTLSTGTDEDGPCLIEPAVRCNHCGYCQSHGH